MISYLRKHEVCEKKVYAKHNFTFLKYLKIKMYSKYINKLLKSKQIKYNTQTFTLLFLF